MDRTPEQWLTILTAKLDRQRSEIKKYGSYFDGTQPLSFATSKYRSEFEQMVRGISDNWMPLIIEAVNERLHVDGFRFGEDPRADNDANFIWQMNGLDCDSELLHLDALKFGVSAAMVWVDDAGLPLITVEHPNEVYVAHAPGTARRRIAALKRWSDEWTNAKYANVYLPDVVLKFQSSSEYADDFKLYEVLPNPLGSVPVVAFRNRLDTYGHYRSELDGFLSTQDQINKLVADMLVSSEFGAFRQRWATGLELPTDPETNKPVQPFKAAIDRLWVSPDENTKFGDFGSTDLGPYIEAITSRIQSLASRSRTPPHYLLASGVFPNGESTKAAETGLISKVRSRQRAFGEGWEEVLRLAFATQNDPRALESSAETIWHDPESRTESEHMDALVKQLALGVPIEALWSEAGYTPQQIERFKVMLREQAVIKSIEATYTPTLSGQSTDPHAG